MLQRTGIPLTIDLPAAPAVTAEQRELIKTTIARGATDDELRLFLYDCARQGVHPLDKLIHFTKRGGRYTPVTSIDLMRTRAAETNEYAGSDDATFEAFDDDGPPVSATVTVYRLTQGQRFAYTATARWREYTPGELAGPLWQKMPHTMLAKCAEALALRKAFPRQLAGLYAAEELDQAEAGPLPPKAPRPPLPAPPPPPIGDPPLPKTKPTIIHAPSDVLDRTQTPPPGAVFLLEVRQGSGRVPSTIVHTGQQGGDDPLPLYPPTLLAFAQDWCRAGVAVTLTTTISTKSGREYVSALEAVGIHESPDRE